MENPPPSDHPPRSDHTPPSREVKVSGFDAEKVKFPNPPDRTIPDPQTLREQWRYATRQYGRWYSQAWGTAILAGVSFFALGWIIKGGNPLPSKQGDDQAPPSNTDR